MPTPEQRIKETLYLTSLFADLSDEELDRLAKELKLEFPQVGTRVIQQDNKSDRMYLIHRGSVELLWNNGREEISMGTLEENDYFGEEGIRKQRPYQFSAEVGPVTALIEISRSRFMRLIKDHPELKQTIDMLMRTQDLIQKLDFDWLGEDENVYLIARRHGFVLFLRLLWPIIFWLIALLFAAWGWLSVLSTPYLVGGLIFVGGLLWAVWIFLDWRNDYYILTNERIIWLEKVIGLYENRQEAPLHTILSTDIRTTQLGRIIGYGDVFVKTFTGEILLDSVGGSQHITDLITEHRQRALQEQEIESRQAIRKTVRQRIGIDGYPPQELPQRVWRKKRQEGPKPPPIWHDIVRMRFEYGDTITYRKHWLILIYRTWLPTLLMIGVLVLMAFGIFNWVTIMGLFLIPFFWWVYQYVDWRNDIFQVTSDKIYDIDRKPLGSEQRREAPLGSILSLEVERIGLFPILFNYGDVIIDVSGTKFIFDTIYNPARAQQEIFRRLDAMRRRKEEGEAQKDRERLAEWFEIYDDETQ